LSASRGALIEKDDVRTELCGDRCGDQTGRPAADNEYLWFGAPEVAAIADSRRCWVIDQGGPLGASLDPHAVLHRRHAGQSAGPAIDRDTAFLADPYAAKNAPLATG
jgi:hypothetical protein